MVHLTFDQASSLLLDLSQPVGQRTRAIFRFLAGGEQRDLDVLCQALKNRNDSELMRHELAYVIGQFQNASACEVLAHVVADEDDDVMVRHEAAEALGAIGDVRGLPVLQEFVKHETPELAQTCELALARIEYVQSGAKESENDKNPYCSVDPAPAAKTSVSTAELRATLLNSSASLFDRYRAMFSLRNRGTPEAVQALIDAFEEPSPLFCHELAYIMGQMEGPATVAALAVQLADTSKHRMVRHEAAEALGAIGTKECELALQAHLNDAVQVVRESCTVGLDIMAASQEYEKERQEEDAIAVSSASASASSFLHVHDKFVQEQA